MRKQRGVRWQSVAEGKWNRDELMEQLAELGAAVLFDFICVLLFHWSVTGVLTEFFPVLSFDFGFYVKLLSLVLLVSLLMETARRLKKLPSVLLQAGVALLGVLVVTRQLHKEEFFSELTEGLGYIASVFLTQWNKYFGTTWMCSPGTEAQAADAAEFMVLIIGIALFWIAKAVKNNCVMAVLPLIVLIAELLVGKSPAGASCFFLFLGILLSINQIVVMPDFRHSEGKGGRRAGKGGQLGWMIGMLAILLICGLVFIVGRQYANTIVTEKAGNVEDFFMDTANTVAEWDFWKMIEDPGSVEDTVDSILGKVDFDHETVDNDKPKFKDIPFLRMTLESKPQDTLYLKGFYADTYKTGTWEKNKEVFEEACIAAGFEPEVVKQELASLSIEKVMSKANVSKLSLSRNAWKASVFYYEPTTIKAYLPYFMEENEEGITVDGEGNYKKRKSDEELELVLWRYGGSYDTRLQSFDTPKTYEWEEWYEDYVEKNYLTVPENMPNVEAVAAELRRVDLSRTKYGSINLENERRLAKAAVVADWMGRNTSYSMDLPSLPKNTDPVEYFLGTSKKGYCMHYASASTLILRKLGVPARYASGYVVTEDTFRATKEDYVAEILDNRAHAWVEIYLEGIGWVPVEVTAGYSTLLPTPTPTPTNTPTPTPTVTNTPVPTPTNTPTPTPLPTNTPVPVLTNVPTPTMDPEETLTPTMEPTASPQGTAVPTQTPAGNPPAAVTPVPTPQEGAEISPGLEATPTYTPTPTPTNAPEKNENTLLSQIPQPSPTIDVEAEMDKLRGKTEKEPLEWYEILGMIVLYFLAAVGLYHLVLAPVFSVDRFFRFEKAYHRRLLREMKRGGNVRAIKMVNRSIYRKLCFSGKIKSGCSDAEYEKVLKETYSVLWPDWERYMEIVKAAEFSLREFTEEEVEFCYKIYRDVIY